MSFETGSFGTRRGEARPNRNDCRSRDEPARLVDKSRRGDRFSPPKALGQLKWQLPRVPRANPADQSQRLSDEFFRFAGTVQLVVGEKGVRISRGSKLRH